MSTHQRQQKSDLLITGTEQIPQGESLCWQSISRTGSSGTESVVANCV